MLWIITAISISYFIGSVPTAYIFGRALKGIDIRQFGSGNVGATNAFRVLGKTTGVSVFIIDTLKGLLPVLFMGNYLMRKDLPISNNLTLIILGLACVCGHNWTVFLRFKGGKGIATTLGVLVALSLKLSGFKSIIGLSILVWLAVFLIFRIVSLASITTAVFLPVLAIIFKQPLEIIIALIILSILAIFRHKSNILKIIKGEEKPLGKRKRFPF